jgi:hypothetical protein
VGRSKAAVPLPLHDSGEPLDAEGSLLLLPEWWDLPLASRDGEGWEQEKKGGLRVPRKRKQRATLHCCY